MDDQTSRDTLQEVKDAGFNTLWPSWWLPSKDELEHINQYGLKVYPNVRVLVDESLKKNDWQILKNAVNKIKDDPAILAWHLFDEFPDWSMDQWLAVYNTIVSLDNHRHAVFANTDRESGSCTGRGINFNAFDFLSTSLYPISSSDIKSLSYVGSVINGMAACRTKNQPIFSYTPGVSRRYLVR